MKKIFFVLSVSFFVISCGPSEEEVMQNEVKKVEETQKLDAEIESDINAMLGEEAKPDSTKK